MNPEIKIFNSISEMAEELVNEFHKYVKELSEKKNQVNIVLSGGSSPATFFRRLGSFNTIDSKKINWRLIHLFWGDERCVAPTHQDSNYGMASRFLIRSIDIPEQNIHRIKGEGIPTDEALVYSDFLKSNVPLRNNFPAFDWIFLGIGNDGHIASIFPDQLTLLFSDKFCEIATHPQTKQMRITLTGKVLINARRITFIISGENKKQIVKEIMNKEPVAKKYPANYIKPVGGRLEWYLDRQAAQLI